MNPHRSLLSWERRDMVVLAITSEDLPEDYFVQGPPRRYRKLRQKLVLSPAKQAIGLLSMLLALPCRLEIFR